MTASTADLLRAGVCYEDAMSALDVVESDPAGGGYAQSFEEAVAQFQRWIERKGRQEDLKAGMDWIRRYYGREEEVLEPVRIPYSSRSKYGSGRGNGAYGINNGSAFHINLTRDRPDLFQPRIPGVTE